jgi:hypothetical protein
MDWICYVFKKGQHVYLVADGCLDDAWKSLAQRQSMSVDNCKKQYKNIGYMNGNGGVWKI